MHFILKILAPQLLLIEFVKIDACSRNLSKSINPVSDARDRANFQNKPTLLRSLCEFSPFCCRNKNHGLNDHHWALEIRNMAEHSHPICLR